MSISRQNLSVVIVTFKSNQIIHRCIESIPPEIKIIIIENSKNKQFKEDLETKYKNVECFLSPENLGMGSGNNLGLKYVNTDYAIILNPDVILEKDTIEEIIDGSKKIDSFAVLAPLSSNTNFPNYKIEKKNINLISENFPFKVKSVDGYAMLFNLNKINKYDDFQDYNYFDENFFMYLENDDLCKRLTDYSENIFIIPKSKVNHLGGKGADSKYSFEIELSRNWHWIWSKFYFNKKHFGFLRAFLNGLPSFLSAIFKYLFYLIIHENKKKLIYSQRIMGFISALFGKTSYYRPKIED